MLCNNSIPGQPDIYAELSKKYPEVTYEGEIPADADPADYYSFSIKAVRVA